MRSLLLLLLAFPAHAQVVGWSDCRHNVTGEKFGYIKVALMDGNKEVRSAVRDFSALKSGANRIEFRELTGPAQVTGMRLACEIITPTTSDLSSEEPQYTLNWRKAVVLEAGATIKPALTITLQQMPDGWRAYIGKAP